MGTEPEDPHFHSDEEEGGPVKSFLDHLEDLRWMLLKSVLAIAVGFMVCLFASPTIVKILKWPLTQAQFNQPEKPNPTITWIRKTLHLPPSTNSHDVIPSLDVYFGTNKLGNYDVPVSVTALFGTNNHAAVELVPMTIGSNVVLVVATSTNSVPDYKERVSLENFGPASAFFLAVHMAIYGGIALAIPFLFYFIGGFVFPALKLHEKKYVYSGLFFGVILFVIGVAFCYFLLMPVALNASVLYSEWLGFKAEIWRAEEYIGFVCKFLLGMGLGFQMPLVILVMVKIGIVSYSQLAGFRRYMIVINLILGALLTTPEIVTQILMAVPLQLLYEISVWIAWYWERRDRKKAEKENRL
ncbi:MAG: Sec-independent protein translocase, TatC subunit [Verrucomicrobiales bacterium]|jgi:sec-independent protein translocase protein TatC|nr:Sec-independent protein translocase, TatC subunit [Verrucomicrobiales bacterium]MDB6131716.1 Sec-independent protein translocase, TatC subunit [Verrucomicrobiales bacterium]